MNNQTSLVNGNFYKYSPVQELNTIYVDIHGSDGAEHTGSAANPFRTLEYAITRVQAGQTIKLNDGVHYVTTGAVLPQYVNLKGNGIDKTFIMPDPAVADINFILVAMGSGAEPLNNDGFHEISGITFDGNEKAVGYGIYNIRRNNVNIHHCKFDHFSYDGVRMANGVIPIAVHAVNCEIHDCIFLDCAGYHGASTYGAIMLEGFSEPKIYNNYINIPYIPGVTQGTPIKGWTGSHDGIKIFNNTIIKDFVDLSTDVLFAIELGRVLGGCEIYNNVIRGCVDIVELSLGRFSYGAKIHHNVVSLERLYEYGPVNYFPAFTFERDACGVYLHHNTVINIAYSVNLNQNTVPCVVNNFNVYYNKFLNIGTTNDINNIRAIRFNSGNVGNTFRDIRIFNNIFEGKLGGATDCALWLPENATILRHLYFKNNIVLNMHDAPVWGRGGGAGYSAPLELEIDNNLIHNCGNANNPLFDFGYVPDAATYTFNDNVQGVDPDFVDPANLNYHLQTGSPAENAGIVNYCVFEDFDNIPIENQPNIGVYER